MPSLDTHLMAAAAADSADRYGREEKGEGRAGTDTNNNNKSTTDVGLRC